MKPLTENAEWWFIGIGRREKWRVFQRIWHFSLQDKKHLRSITQQCEYNWHYWTIQLKVVKRKIKVKKIIAKLIFALLKILPWLHMYSVEFWIFSMAQTLPSIGSIPTATSTCPSLSLTLSSLILSAKLAFLPLAHQAHALVKHTLSSRVIPFKHLFHV